MKKWKEVLEKKFRIVQACGCICLIGVLGFGIYSLQKESIPAKETEVVVTEKKQEKSTTQKAEKTDQSKKQEIKSAKAEIKKVEKETGKNPVKKADTSSGQKVEKKEEKKSNTEKSESSKEQKPQEQSAPTLQPSKPEQKPQQSPAPAPQQPSQPEQKPSQPTQKPSQPTPPQQPQQPSQPEQKPQECVHNWVYHPEQGHENTYTVTEEVYEPWECCNVCGADCTADPSGHMEAHALAGEGGGRHTEYFKIKEVTKTEWVVDVPAYTECSGCGARQ